MAMPAVALAVALSLVGPAVMTAVCELSCLQALHHATGEAYAHECHDGPTADQDGPLASGAGGVLCHDDGEGPAARVIVAPVVAMAPATAAEGPLAMLQFPTAGASEHIPPARPPDSLRLRTQLRI